MNINFRDILASWPRAPRRAYILWLLLFALVGVWGGRLVGQGFVRQTGLISLGPKASTSDRRAAGQRNVLLIGVDRLSAKTPKLESTWLIMYFPGIPDFTLLPIFPALDSDDPFITTAEAEAFYLEGSGEPGARFLENLSNQIWWSNYLVIDEIGLEDLVDGLGGVMLRGRQQSGSNVLSELHALNDSGQLPVFQMAMILAVCAQASRGVEVELLRTLIESTEERVATDLDLIQELESWHEERVELPSIRCEFPLGYASVP